MADCQNHKTKTSQNVVLTRVTFVAQVGSEVRNLRNFLVWIWQELSSYSSVCSIFQRDFHRLESKLVFMASLVGANEKILTSKSSGKLLILSENVTSLVLSFAAFMASKKKLWEIGKSKIVCYEVEIKP